MNDIKKYLHLKNVLRVAYILQFLKNWKTIVESLEHKRTLTLKDIFQQESFFWRLYNFLAMQIEVNTINYYHKHYF